MKILLVTIALVCLIQTACSSKIDQFAAYEEELRKIINVINPGNPNWHEGLTKNKMSDQEEDLADGNSMDDDDDEHWFPNRESEKELAKVLAGGSRTDNDNDGEDWVAQKVFERDSEEEFVADSDEYDEDWADKDWAHNDDDDEDSAPNFVDDDPDEELVADSDEYDEDWADKDWAHNDDDDEDSARNYVDDDPDEEFVADANDEDDEYWFPNRKSEEKLAKVLAGGSRSDNDNDGEDWVAQKFFDRDSEEELARTARRSKARRTRRTRRSRCRKVCTRRARRPAVRRPTVRRPTFRRSRARRGRRSRCRTVCTPRSRARRVHRPTRKPTQKPPVIVVPPVIVEPTLPTDRPTENRLLRTPAPVPATGPGKPRPVEPFEAPWPANDEPVIFKPSWDKNVMVIKSDWADKTMMTHGYHKVLYWLSRWLCRNGVNNYDYFLFFPMKTNMGMASRSASNMGMAPDCSKLRSKIYYPTGFADGGPFMHELMHGFISGKDKTMGGLVAWGTDGIPTTTLAGEFLPGGRKLQTSHWMFTILDKQGQLGGYPYWGVFCKTRNGYKQIYPDISKCVKSNGKYDLLYSFKAGSPTTSHDGGSISDYELAIVGVKDVSEIVHQGIIGVGGIFPKKKEEQKKPVYAPDDLLLSVTDSTKCHKYFGTAPNENGGCKTFAEMRNAFHHPVGTNRAGLKMKFPQDVRYCTAENCYNNPKSKCPRNLVPRRGGPRCKCSQLPSSRKLLNCQPWRKPERGDFMRATPTTLSFTSNAEVGEYIRSNPTLLARQIKEGDTLKVVPITIVPQNERLTESNWDQLAGGWLVKMTNQMRSREKGIPKMTDNRIKISTRIN